MSALAIREGGRERLLSKIEVSDLEPMEEAPPPGCWERCVGATGRLISLIGGASAVAIRVLNITPLTNVLSSLGIGFCAQWLTDSYAKEKKELALIHRVTGTALGQMTLFGLTQVGYYIVDPWGQAVINSMIVALGGAAVARMWREKALLGRIESHVPHRPEAPKLYGFLFSRRLSQGVALPQCLIAALGARYFHDPVLKNILAFLSAHWGSKFLGEQFCMWMLRKMKEEVSIYPQAGLTGIQKSKYRMALIVTQAIGHLISLFSLPPWTGNPFSGKRIVQLALVGGLTGFPQGMALEAWRDRVCNVPIEQLSELQRYPSPVNHLAYRVWWVAWPGFITGFFGAFTLEQILCELTTLDQMTALSATFLTFAGTLTFANLIDTSFEVKQRVSVRETTIPVRMKDWAISFLMMPEILGVNPAYVFFVMTNSLLMDDEAIASDSPLRRGIVFGGWGFYGMAMALEFWKFWCDRVGLPLSRESLLLFINVVLVGYREIVKKLP